MAYSQVDINDVDTLIENPNWDMQQKVDGIRARLIVSGNDVYVIGSTGGDLVSTTAAPVTERLMALGNHTARNTPGVEFELEGEIIGEKFWVFDMPMNSRASVNHYTVWSKRQLCMEEFVWSLGVVGQATGNNWGWVALLPVVRGTEKKAAFWKDIQEIGAEGAIFKHRDSTVEDGRRVDHVLKVKITHTIDCFVIERGPGNGRNGAGNWLSLGLYKKDGSVYEAGRCSFIGKPVAHAGEVIELRYLYAGAGGRLVQPTHLRNRPDKNPEDCTTEQLHFVSKKVLLYF